jgi:hypothetical protein
MLKKSYENTKTPWLPAKKAKKLVIQKMIQSDKIQK